MFPKLANVLNPSAWHNKGQLKAHAICSHEYTWSNTTVQLIKIKSKSKFRKVNQVSINRTKPYPSIKQATVASPA